MKLGILLLAHDVQAIDEGEISLDTYAHNRYLQSINIQQCDRNLQVTKRVKHYVKVKDR